MDNLREVKRAGPRSRVSLPTGIGGIATWRIILYEEAVLRKNTEFPRNRHTIGPSPNYGVQPSYSSKYGIVRWKFSRVIRGDLAIERTTGNMYSMVE